MKKNIHALWMLLMLCCPSQMLQGQNRQELPYSFRHKVSRYIPDIQMPAVNTETLLAMEAESSKQGEFTFGKAFAVELNTLNTGLWEILPNGDRLWRLGITSKNAYSINLIFSYFYLPEGSCMHIYTADSSYILGSYTSRHNLPERTFATPLLPGEKIVLEYYEPLAVRGQGALHLSTVVHAYKDFYFKYGKFGGSGNCNMDIKCPEGAAYQEIGHSVCMILKGTKILCSGTLINNTAEDKTPYLLTAYHCLNSTEPSEMVFIFNHDADACGSQTYSEGFAISGATLVAKNFGSDFALLKLSQTPPIYYNVYYAGWNRTEMAATSAVCIHHPSGDVKKISVCNQQLQHSNADGENGNSHWRIPFWSKGTTEGGSSGCGLFNSDGQLIGQLDGGTASCMYNDGYDVFGKLALSWDNPEVDTSSRRLKDWLDPLKKGYISLNGLNPNHSDFENEVALLELIAPEEKACGMQLRPQLRWLNNGNRTLTEMDFCFQLDSGTIQKITRKGKWSYGTIDTFFLDTLYHFREGMHCLRAWSVLPEDEQHGNDTLKRTFSYHRGISLRWEIKTDYRPEQTRWVLKDAQGKILAENPQKLHFMTTFRDTFCLEEGCYDFVIYDSCGNGLNGDNGYGQGYYYLYLQEKCIARNIQFGFKDSIRFCIDSTLSISAPASPEIFTCVTLYPNPCSSQLNIDIAPMQEGNCSLALYTVDGRKLQEWNHIENHTQISTRTLPKGAYLIHIYGEKTCINKLFIKE